MMFTWLVSTYGRKMNPILRCVLFVIALTSLIRFVESEELVPFVKEKDDLPHDLTDVELVHVDNALKSSVDGKVGKPPESSEKSSLEDTTRQAFSYGFLHAFIASLSVIIVSELGDKTFFIAAIMAMRHPRTTVFIGAIGALGLMTVLSVFLGYATTVIPRKYTFYISTALFAIFGLKMLKEGYDMDPNEGQEEYEEVQAELKKKEAELEQETVQDMETGIIRNKVKRSKVYRFFARLCSPILIQAFTMTFLAEWGDRSQLTTIILGSREDPLGVSIGGTLGHALCTGLAVIGGRLIAQRISVRTVTLIGGVVFLLFALSALYLNDITD